MRIEALSLHRVRLALVTPFRAAHGTTEVRELVLVRVRTDGPDGWGECSAEAAPTYAPEYVEGAWHVLVHHLGPRLLAAGRLDGLDAADVEGVLAPVRGHPMAKAALEAAVLDAQLRTTHTSLATHLGASRTSVPAGVAVGITATVADLLALVEGYAAQGYRRVKLKVQPGWDVEPVRAVRRLVGDAVEVAADANGAYRAGDPDHRAALDALDDLGLQLLEQPFAPDDLLAHAAAAHRLATPVALDESLTSSGDVEAALALQACDAVVLKAARVGGMAAAARIEGLCRARGIPVACGGMLESGLGRAAAVALAALDGVVLTGDLSASDRYFAEDLTEPFVLGADGTLAVPDGPGTGRDVDPGRLAAATVATAELTGRGRP